MDKYYVPTIDEFHVGFEYEECVLGKWFETDIEGNDFINGDLEILYEQIIDNEVRVKYLDRDDIESLGFEFIKDKSLGNLTHRYEIRELYNRILDGYDDAMWWNVYLKHYPDRHIVTIKGDISTGDCEKFAEVVIKNKSELKRLMKQLNIIK